jgi:hypothetical protein
VNAIRNKSLIVHAGLDLNQCQIFLRRPMRSQPPVHPFVPVLLALLAVAGDARAGADRGPFRRHGRVKRGKA